MLHHRRVPPGAPVSGTLETERCITLTAQCAHDTSARHCDLGDGVAPPRVIAWEVTRSCNLACVHCRASRGPRSLRGRAEHRGGFTLVDQIASFANPILILTGGEPLMRADVFDIAEYAIGSGLRTVMSPNGTLVTPEVAQRMHDVRHRPRQHLHRLPTAAEHDEFRGVPGAFDGAVRGIQNCLAAGVEVQINSTITKLNAHYLPALLQLAVDLGAVALPPVHAGPHRARQGAGGAGAAADEYEKALEWMYDAQQESDLFMKPTDVPHYWRVMRQRAKAQGRKLEVHPHSHGGMNTLSRGCLAGIGFCFISHIGEVQGCGYFDKVAGDVRKQTFPEVWRDSPLFNELRDFDGLKGKCGACEFKKVCGGCRARAYEATGDYMAEEPYCAYVPKGWCIPAAAV